MEFYDKQEATYLLTPELTKNCREAVKECLKYKDFLTEASEAVESDRKCPLELR